MVNIVIPYFSGSGHTLKLAQEVQKGAQEVDQVSALLLNVDPVTDLDWNKLHEADAIIFGAPTYMGSLPWQFKRFIDEASMLGFWTEQKWTNKIAAGFTIGTSASGDKLNTLIQMSVFSAQHGMIWVGQNHIGSKHTKDGKKINDVGSWLGLSATSNPDKDKMIYEHDVLTAQMFGRRIVEATQKWQGS